MSRVLVVEDDPGIRSALIHALSDRGHAVDSAPNAMTGLQAAINGGPDVVILDLGLPDLDGVELLRMLRAVSTTPVIVATARDDDEQVVRALDCGADDYMIKPFSADTLDARIRAVLRRTATNAPSTELSVGGLAPGRPWSDRRAGRSGPRAQPARVRPPRLPHGAPR